MSKKPKKNFMRKSSKHFKKEDGFTTVFHMGISSKALFGLSEGALKLYMFFVLNGKKHVPSIKLFAARMRKSERTIARYYEELKEKGFLRLICIRPRVYEYRFDFNGNIEYKPVEKTEYEEAEAPTTNKEQEEVVETKDDEIIKKAETVIEYEDFAILENLYWRLNKTNQEKVLSILEERKKREPDSKGVIDWFVEKVKYY